MKSKERMEARRLRREYGMGSKPIARRLGVSSSSVMLWTSDITLTNAQRGQLDREASALRAEKWSRQCRERRRAWQMEGRERARQGDPLHEAGCMLYWAEGEKVRNALVFANSDLSMVTFFARFLRESMAVPSEDLRIRLNVYLNNGIDLEAIEHHWLSALDLSRESLRAHSLNHYPTSSSGKKRTLPYGVCTLRVARSTSLVQHIFGAIQEYASFEEPRWLDGPPRQAKRNAES
jgi:hypothetical protein